MLIMLRFLSTLNLNEITTLALEWDLRRNQSYMMRTQKKNWVSGLKPIKSQTRNPIFDSAERNRKFQIFRHFLKFLMIRFGRIKQDLIDLKAKKTLLTQFEYGSFEPNKKKLKNSKFLRPIFLLIFDSIRFLSLPIGSH